MIKEYYQTLKSNIRITQTEIMKEYIFLKIHLNSNLQKWQFAKQQLGRDISFCNHIPHPMGL